MGVEGGLGLGCTEPAPPENDLKSGNLKALDVDCKWGWGHIHRVPWNP